MIPYLILGASIICVAVGQLNFKLYAVKSSRGRLVLAMSLLALAQLGFFVSLMDLRIGIVYMSTALTQVLVLTLSHYVLKETVTRHHVLAVAMIVCGLVLYAA